MHDAQKHSIFKLNRCFIERYVIQLAAFVMVLLMMTGTSYGLVQNNGVDTICPAGSIKGVLSNNSYQTLMSSYNSNSFQSVVSTSNSNIPLQIKMSMQELPNSNSNVTNSFSVNNINSQTALNINKTFDNIQGAATKITLSFRSSDTQQPMFLSKVALSAFDIDGAIQNGANFDDYIKFKGVTEDGSIIDANIQSISGSEVVNYDNGLRMRSINNRGCDAKDLDSRCQGSVVFDQPVKSVILIYANTERVNPAARTSQEIDFRLDSYCYLPTSYVITKDDGVDEVATTRSTEYFIKVTNTGGTPLSNISLKDPAVTGLTKLSNIRCDSSDSNNMCRIAPTISQLERASGFNISSLPVGKSYSIVVPALVTAGEGSAVTNTATISTSNLTTKSASDSNQVTSLFDGGYANEPAICPSGHKMYYLGANPPSYSPIQTQPLAWTRSSGYAKQFSFGNINLNLGFTDILSLENGYPEYSSISGVTTNAINMYHNSPYAPVNHRLSATIDVPVSKFGFVVQDLDSNRDSYIESLSFDTSKNNATGGAFSFSNALSDSLELSNSNQTISSKRWVNCNPSSNCNFNVDWGYQSANTPFVITHGNIFNTSTSPAQVVGYSDFYFCLAPPKLVVKKQLDGSRVNDTSNKRDQFEISVDNSESTLSSFTTAGTGSTLSDNLSSVIELSENQSYKISERVLNGAAKGSLSSYNTRYVCTNKTTKSTTIMPSDDMVYDAVSKTRSFTLSGVKYGDEISCTITNTPSVYTFSGRVFNDNGGLIGKTSDDTNGMFINEASYFNGVFNTNELGISGVTHPNLKISLTNCSGANISGTEPQTVSDSGEYKFSVPSSSLQGVNSVCLVQSEPETWAYTVDTSPNELKVVVDDMTYNYNSNDFGEVISGQAALVLKKYQYVHQCNVNLDYKDSSINATNIISPLDGFSMQPINDLDPGQCIAYKVVASNHGHKDLTMIKITDVLQKQPLISRFHLPLPIAVTGSTATVPKVILKQTSQPSSDIANMGDNGVVTTEPFNLPNSNNSNVLSQLILYFNTKYGSSADSETQ